VRGAGARPSRPSPRKRTSVTDPGRRLEGKVALVTGASRGIGEAISRRFGRDGARVALAARDEEACRRIAGEIAQAGGEAFAVRCDVTDRRSIAGAVAAVIERWGRIDVLVNNAGLGGPTPLDDPDDSRWDAILATNLSGVFRVTREAAPHIPDGGRVINLSSVVGRFGVAGLAAYSATKHGVIGLTRTFALELAPRRITVNAMCPGWVETDMARDGYQRIAEIVGSTEEKGREIAAKMAPLRRIVEPDEVAGLASYLASDDARSMTGQAIVLDGGQVMP
jgi:NAD(P)-dependent dehydrogenase (short-subunit alcohol dehydrogenase family)